MFASREGDLNMVRELMKNGADINAKSADGKLVYIFVCYMVIICHIFF